MNQKERLVYLVNYLMEENAQGDQIDIKPILPIYERELLQMFRGLINVRMPYPIDQDFLNIQDDFLKEWHRQRGFHMIEDLELVENQIYLWQGDITSLKVDAIVNAANSEFLGCFIPNHRCIDNEIQTKGGYQIRLDVTQIRQEQGHKEPVGKAKITAGHNLPAKYIIHTVAPITMGQVSPLKAQMLENCYHSVLKKADEYQLDSIAICCIGTGQFGFPQDQAADIAIHSVKQHLKESGTNLKVIFNVFEDRDLHIYQEKLNLK